MSIEDRECEKCKEIKYCEDHHKYPEHAFNKYGEENQENPIIVLCKRCHIFLHRIIGWIFTRKGNEQPLEFYDEKTDEFMNND